MARPRKIPDSVVYDTVLTLLASRGEKAVTFSAIAALSGLAASSLAERHGSIQAMIASARAFAWTQLDEATVLALAGAGPDAKGAVALLKALNGVQLPDGRDDPDRAVAWREGVEAELSRRLGGVSRGREAATLLFSVWHSQRVWPAAAGNRLRLKEVLRRLGY